MAITVDDVRHYMLDFPAYNKLYDHTQVFTDDDINRALNWSVEGFNSEPPMHIRITSIADIPSNNLILMGAVIWLLRSLVIKMQRNQLDYNDGGVSVSDQNNHQYIQQFLGPYVAEYKDLLSRTKQFININEGYGGLDSQWAGIGTGIDFRGSTSTSG
jgi:hypothetical protein